MPRHNTPQHHLPGKRAWLLVAALGLLVHTTVTAAPAVDDTMARRLQACTACHGEQGRAAPDGYHPRLAGKPVGYLYNQLRHFQEGRRTYGPMVQVLSTLSDTYLQDIARHFAAQTVPYPPPAPVTAAPPVLEHGRTLVEQGDSNRGIPACASCHGVALTGRQPATPGLLGLPRDYINAQLGAWRQGLRRADAPDCMRSVAEKLDPTDIAAVSAWLATRPVPTASSPSASPYTGPVRCGSAALAPTAPGGRP
jgi:cytochrome c553